MLHLAHHKHTGKLLPHHHTSFRGLFLLLLVVGVVMFSVQQSAHAAFMDLSAKISNALPTTAPTIDSPQDGDNFNHPDIFVSGTCENLDPSSIVIVYIDGSVIAGSVTCKSGGIYAVPITLPAGTHSLSAKISNTTDDLGPGSTPIYVTYVPKEITPTPGGTTGASTGTGTTGTKTAAGTCAGASTPLRISSSQTYLEYGRSLAAEWQFSISGGCAPYTTIVDWGDGITDTIKVANSEIQSARHGYAELKPAFFVTMRAISADKQRATFSTVAVTPYIPSVYGNGLVEVETPFVLSVEGNILKAYVAYAATLALVGVIWYDVRVRRLRLAGVHVFGTHPDNPTDENGWRLRIPR